MEKVKLDELQILYALVKPLRNRGYRASVEYLRALLDFRHHIEVYHPTKQLITTARIYLYVRPRPHLLAMHDLKDSVAVELDDPKMFEKLLAVLDDWFAVSVKRKPYGKHDPK